MPASSPRKPIVAVTMGDPGGIGPEVILKSLQSIPLSQSYQILLIGSRSVFEFTAKRCGIKLPPINPIQTLSTPLFRDDSVNLLDVSNEADVIYKKIAKKEKYPGRAFDLSKVSLLNGALAFASLKIAARQAACGLVQAIVTAPVNKEAMRLVDPRFIGHTEYLAKVSGVKEFAMSFYSEYFCVTLATIHLPLKKVAGKITQKSVFSKIKLTHDFLKNMLKIKSPKIAVACLNPHGSEFGAEEEKEIVPAICAAQKKGILVSGPLPGDQVFHEAYQKKYHAVVSMYHDQGLAPFKMIAFDTGVNVTLGLPFVRTCPDHGTAFDIAYQNKANPASFQASLALAIELTRRL